MTKKTDANIGAEIEKQLTPEEIGPLERPRDMKGRTTQALDLNNLYWIRLVAFAEKIVDGRAAKLKPLIEQWKDNNPTERPPTVPFYHNKRSSGGQERSSDYVSNRMFFDEVVVGRSSESTRRSSEGRRKVVEHIPLLP